MKLDELLQRASMGASSARPAMSGSNGCLPVATRLKDAARRVDSRPRAEGIKLVERWRATRVAVHACARVRGAPHGFWRAGASCDRLARRKPPRLAARE